MKLPLFILGLAIAACTAPLFGINHGCRKCLFDGRATSHAGDSKNH